MQPRQPRCSLISMLLAFAAVGLIVLVDSFRLDSGVVTFGIYVAPLAGVIVAIGSFLRGERPLLLAFVGLLLNLSLVCLAPALTAHVAIL